VNNDFHYAIASLGVLGQICQ